MAGAADREWWAEQARQRAVLRGQQQANANQNAQQQAGLAQQAQARDAYAMELGRMDRAAMHSQNAQVLGLYGQAALSQQQHAQGMESQTHQVDLQARLNEVQLNQAEQQRMARLQHAIAGVEDNPDLAPSERNMLIGQLRSGLNPMENRQREQQVLMSHLQGQALSQQTDQQATLFNQRQHRLAQTAQDRTAVLTDPLTGQRQLFMMDLDGHYQPLDFSLAHQRFELQQRQTEEAMAASQQQRVQSAALFPGQLQGQQLGLSHAGLANQQLQQSLSVASQLAPHQVEHAGLVNQQITQALSQGAELHPGQLAMQGAHLADLTQRVWQAAQMQPGNVALQNANIHLLEQRIEQGPETFQSEQAYRAAQTELAQAHHRQVSAQVAQMPAMLRLHEAEVAGRLSHQQVQSAHITAETEMLRMRQNQIPDNLATHLLESVMNGVDREINNRDLLPAERERLQQNRSQTIQDRLDQAIPHLRHLIGMPRNPQANPPGNQGGGANQGGANQGNGNEPPRVQPFNPNVNPANLAPAQQALLQHFAGLQQQITRTMLHPDEQQQLETSRQRILQLIATHGSRDRMPDAARNEYDRLYQRLQHRLWFGQPRDYTQQQ